jgi:hypothetical protein
MLSAKIAPSKSKKIDLYLEGVKLRAEKELMEEDIGDGDFIDEEASYDIEE